MIVRKRGLCNLPRKSLSNTSPILSSDYIPKADSKSINLNRDSNETDDFITKRNAFAVICALTVLAYGSGLNGDLVFDDTSAIVRNADIRPNQSDWFTLFGNDFWGTPMNSDLSHKSYRPLTVLTFRLNYIIHELQPFGYHLVNLTLHMVACCLFLYLSASVVWNHSIGGLLPFASAVLFTVHPVHVEAVTSVVGRAELLSAIFFFGAILFFSRDQLACCSLCAGLALFCKEQGITCIAVCFVLLLCRPQWRRTLRLGSARRELPFRHVCTAVWLVTLFIILSGIRVWVMGGWSGRPVFSRFDNPASTAASPQRQLHYNYLLYWNSMLLLWPTRLCCDWTMNSIPLIEGWSDPRNIFTALFYVIFIALLFVSVSQYFVDKLTDGDDNRRFPLLVALSLLVFPFIPASNLLQPVGFVIAERVLYLPSAGYCILIVLAAQRIVTYWPHLKPIVWSCFAIMVIAFTIKSSVRSLDWKNELRLFESGVEVNPNNAKLHNNIGHYFEKSKQWSVALKHFRRAQQLQPDDVGCSINVARTLINMGESTLAERILWKLRPVIRQHAVQNQKRLDPGHLKLWMHLGNLLAGDPQRLDEAEKVYRELITMRNDFVDAYINLGDVLIKKSKLTEAVQVYEQALSFKQRQSDLYHNLGVVHAMLLDRVQTNHDNMDELNQQRDKIGRYFASAIEHEPNHREAMLNLAILMQKDVRLLTDLRPWLKQRMQDYNESEVERVWFNLALLFVDDGDKVNAEYWLRRSADHSPKFASARFNLALLLVDQKRVLDAQRELILLVEHHPNHHRGWAVLGDLNVQLGRLIEAESNYKQVLALQRPVSLEIMNNLCIVYRMQKQMDKSHQCFEQLQRLKQAKNRGH